MDGMVDDEAMNLYFVRTVHTQEKRGETERLIKHVAVFGMGVDAGLVAHEIGHNHALSHSEQSDMQYGEKNIMHSLSKTREYFSEGEVFRMHFDDYSMRNWCPLKGSPGKWCSPKRSGALSCGGATCPSIGIRLRAEEP